MLLIVFVTAATVIFLRFVIQKSFSVGDSIVQFLKNTLHLRENVAVLIYRLIFYNNIETITLIVILVFLVILLKFTISWFTKYFDEVSAGMDRLAEKFFRLDTSRSTNTGGAGLGLAIAKEIVNAHGGNIFVQSNTEKTVFTVVLPQRPENEPMKKVPDNTFNGGFQ